MLPSQPYVPGQALRFDGLAVSAKGTPANGDRLQIAPSTRGDLFGVLERAANAIETGAPSLAGDIARATTELDAGMDRLLGAPEALEFVKANLFDAPTAAFDAAFSTQSEG